MLIVIIILYYIAVSLNEDKQISTISVDRFFFTYKLQ